MTHLSLRNPLSSFKNIFSFSLISVKPVVNKIRQFRLTRDDFETVRIIGRGAFGEVRETVQMKGRIFNSRCTDVIARFYAAKVM